MKNQIESHHFLQQFLVVFGFFIMLSTVITAQNTREQLENEIRYIDNEMKRLTYKKEAIGLEFEAISNFSMNARPILAEYNQIVEAIELKDKEVYKAWMYSDSETIEEKKAEYQSLITQRDNHLRQFRNSNGVMGVFGSNSNTIGGLQNEWQKTVNYYLDKKREYDDITLELGNLNIERHNIVAELNDLGGVSGLVLDLQGCWLLTTGKYTSTITVTTKDLKEFVGHLTVNNLNKYIDGQVMFTVIRVSPDTFRGMEVTFKEVSPGHFQGINIPMKITIHSDNNFLTWTSDETVTMRRCY